MPRDYQPDSFAERDIISAYLDYARATVRTKCEGLTEEQARQIRLPGSPDMTVVGIVRHLAWGERAWFEGMLLGDPAEDQRIDAEPDAGMNTGGTLADALAGYEAQAARYRDLVADMDLDTETKGDMGSRGPVTLRWILFHLIEETARHNGHLDILRELIDGTTGV